MKATTGSDALNGLIALAQMAISAVGCLTGILIMEDILALFSTKK